MTCTPPSSITTTYSPPLTSTPTSTIRSVSAQYGPCVSLSQPDLTSATTSSTSQPRTRTCSDLLASGPLTFTITWNTGQNSTVSANSTTTLVGALLITTQTGIVTDGLFKGDTVIQTSQAPAATITACELGLGNVPSLYGLLTLEVTSI
ncbi:hypothetical protein GT043_02300 [Streptomyces sp. SID2131]|nr:hypothetical protein [Streptomyces sp. SID2131]